MKKDKAFGICSILTFQTKWPCPWPQYQKLGPREMFASVSNWLSVWFRHDRKVLFRQTDRRTVIQSHLMRSPPRDDLNMQDSDLIRHKDQGLSTEWPGKTSVANGRISRQVNSFSTRKVHQIGNDLEGTGVGAYYGITEVLPRENSLEEALRTRTV